MVPLSGFLNVKYEVTVQNQWVKMKFVPFGIGFVIAIIELLVSHFATKLLWKDCKEFITTAVNSLFIDNIYVHLKTTRVPLGGLSFKRHMQKGGTAVARSVNKIGCRPGFSSIRDHDSLLEITINYITYLFISKGNTVFWL